MDEAIVYDLNCVSNNSVVYNHILSFFFKYKNNYILLKYVFSVSGQCWCLLRYNIGTFAI